MTSRDPTHYIIPLGAPPRSCLACGKRIFFVETHARRHMPVNPDGSSHFIDCPQREKFRGKTRAELTKQGELFGKGR